MDSAMDSAMRARMDPELLKLSDRDPDAVVEAIVTAESTLEALLERLPASLVVHYTYRLIPGVAVSGPVGALESLAMLSVVRSIEPVRAVHHC